MLPTVQDSSTEAFLDLVRLLKPHAISLGGLQARGEWALSFRERHDVLFFWVEQGECQLLRQDGMSMRIAQGDFVLIRTDIPFIIASNMSAERTDSEVAVAAAKGQRLELGAGPENLVVLNAGKFIFDIANQDLLVSLLPALVHLRQGNQSLRRVHSLLAMNAEEMNSEQPGRAFVIALVVELLLVEILRAAMLSDCQLSGLLAGLADRITARALNAMHADVSRPWTVATLARHCAMSRSSLAMRFCSILGMGPMVYLQRLRMALAKDALRSGTRSITEIALSVGFKSQSAFSTAFARKVGCPPTRYAVDAIHLGTIPA